MELQLNRSDPSTLGIESSIEANLLIWVVRPIKERCLANTTFHVAFVDFEPIRKRKSLTGSNTN
jgi:hypothetical protein